MVFLSRECFTVSAVQSVCAAVTILMIGAADADADAACSLAGSKLPLQPRRLCLTWGSQRGFQLRSFMKRKIAEAAGAAAGACRLLRCCSFVSRRHCFAHVATTSSVDRMRRCHKFSLSLSYASLSQIFTVPAGAAVGAACGRSD